MDGTQIGGRHWSTIGIVGIGCCIHCEHENLAQAGGNRPEGRLERGRQTAFGGTEAFAHLLAREIYVGAFLKDDSHLR